MGIGRIGHNTVHQLTLVPVWIVVIKIRPVVSQRIAAAHTDIGGVYAAHNQINSCNVISILNQLLGVIGDVAAVLHIFFDALAYIYKQRTRIACRVQDFYLLPIPEMMRDNLRNKH